MSSGDVLIVGGGVVGLTIAIELAEQGVQVRVIDRGSVGREASWAGAGMIPPGEIHLKNDAYRKMAKLSSQLWSPLSKKLDELSGIQNEYFRCGAIIVSGDSSGDRKFDHEQKSWNTQGVATEVIDPPDASCSLLSESAKQRSSYLLPGQAQVRNPRHLQALRHACLCLGVEITEHQQVRAFETQGETIQAAMTETDRYTAGHFLFATGAWSSDLGDLLNVSIPVMPIRGQIVLLKTSGQLKRIIEQGKKYLVPRTDGRLLIGATEERVGFARHNTASAIRDLIQFAAETVPSLSECEVEKTWFGFRPGSPDNLPILGQLGQWENAFVATGQYRAGLSLSPITGRLMRQLMLKETLDVPLTDFSPDRFAI